MNAGEEWTGSGGAMVNHGTTTIPSPSLGECGCWQHPHGTESVFHGTTASPQQSHPPQLGATRMLAAPSRDWSVFKQIFADHWDAFQRAHPRYQTPYYDGLVAKMLACGNPEKMGYIEYRCLHCGQGKHLVAMSCKSSLCLRCAKVYVDNWVSQVSQVLHEGVIYRHIILTVPAMFRTTFYQQRGGRVECVHALRGAVPG